MNYLLRTFTLIASILIFSLIIEVALANVHTDNKQKVELKTDSIGILHKINDSCAPPAKINLNTVSDQNMKLNQ